MLRVSSFASSLTKYYSRFLPNIDHDLTHCIRQELSTMEVSSLLAPQVFGYVPTSSSSSNQGAFRGSLSAQNYNNSSTSSSTMMKIEVPMPTKQGLCHG